MKYIRFFFKPQTLNKISSMKVPNKMDNVQSKEWEFYDSNRDLTGERKLKVERQSHLFVRSISHQSEHKDLYDSMLVVPGDPYFPGLGCFLWMDPKPCLANEIFEGETVYFSQIPMLGFQKTLCFT